MWIRIGYVHGDNSPVVCNQDTGYHCNSILRIKLRTMHAIVHGIVRYCMVLHGVAWCCMVLYGIGWYVLYRVLYGIGWYVWYVYCMALLYGVSVCLYCLVLHCMHE